MRPLPLPGLAGVTVLLPFAIRPMTGSVVTFCFLGARSPLSNGLFFAEGLLEPVPMAPSFVSFFFAARFLMTALLFASSISEKGKRVSSWKTTKLNMDADGLMLTGALLVLDGRRSGFRSVTIPMDGVKVYKLSPRLFLWFGL